MKQHFSLTTKRQTFWRLPLFLSGLLLLSQAFPLAAPVRDAASGVWVAGYTLHFPRWHLFFSPFCGLADLITVLSLHQLILTAVYVIGGCFIFLPWRKAGLVVIAFLMFVAWGALVPHPMSRLISSDPDVLLIDFHSHSCVSHDGRPSFTPEANMAWHQAQGYGASFITDHNRVESSQKAKAVSRQDWQATGYRSLEGEEVSLYRTHLVLLGNHERVDNSPYDSDPTKIPVFLKDMHKKGWIVIASLPEYWFYHWGQGVQDFVVWKMDGFEILNSAPKALDFPPAHRLEIVELCRQHNLPMTGISDNHGYGYATAAWNAMWIPGWQQLDPDRLEQAVLQILRKEGFGAVQVLERAVYRPGSRWKVLISPFVNLALYWRSLQLFQVLSWIGWVWFVGPFLGRLKL